MTVTQEGETLDVQGATCKRGERYARQEFVQPLRTLTSLVRVDGGSRPVFPVKTEGVIPKEKIPEALQVLRQMMLKGPVHAGDIVIKDVVGTDVSIVLTAGD